VGAAYTEPPIPYCCVVGLHLLMGDLSRHFSRREFACKCGCGLSDVSDQLIDDLEMVRAHFGGRRITITSGCRCEFRNDATPGAASSSKHLPGKDGCCHAADFWVDKVHEDDVAEFLEDTYPQSHGVGRYDNRTHLDDRKHRARWDFRS